MAAAALVADSSLTALRLQLGRHHERLTKLFKQWDPTNVGIVTRRDFHRAIATLNLDVGTATVDALFTHIDSENTNYIDYGSLRSMIASPEPRTSTASPSLSPPKTPLMLQVVASAQTEMTYVNLAVLEAECEDWRLRALAAEQRALRLEEESRGLHSRVATSEIEATSARATALSAQDELERARSIMVSADQEAARTRAVEQPVAAAVVAGVELPPSVAVGQPVAAVEVQVLQHRAAPLPPSAERTG